MLSVVITYHNEGQSFLEECIKEIRDTTRIFPLEIIVVDDHSTVPLKLSDDITVIRHEWQKGVGAAFDTGVAHAKYNNIFLIACDMRFIDNGWADKLHNEIQLYPKSLICTACVALNKDNMDISLRRNVSRVAGATILIFHDQKSNPKKKSNFRGLTEAKWLPYKAGESYEVPCILGACYGTTREWYEYIGGFWGHRLWSNLEPLISMKSWLFGGSCRVVPEAETGHIFKREGTHGTPHEALIYNKLLISTLLFDDSDRLIRFLGNSPIVQLAKRQFQSSLDKILKKKQEYKEKTILSMDEFADKFHLDLRK